MPAELSRLLRIRRPAPGRRRDADATIGFTRRESGAGHFAAGRPARSDAIELSGRRADDAASRIEQIASHPERARNLHHGCYERRDSYSSRMDVAPARNYSDFRGWIKGTSRRAPQARDLRTDSPQYCRAKSVYSLDRRARACAESELCRALFGVLERTGRSASHLDECLHAAARRAKRRTVNAGR